MVAYTVQSDMVPQPLIILEHSRAYARYLLPRILLALCGAVAFSLLGARLGTADIGKLIWLTSPAWLAPVLVRRALFFAQDGIHSGLVPSFYPSLILSKRTLRTIRPWEIVAWRLPTSARDNRLEIGLLGNRTVSLRYAVNPGQEGAVSGEISRWMAYYTEWPGPRSS